MIKLKNIYKAYGDKVILNNLSLEIKEGDFISIIGESGSGKSTLLNILGLVDQFDGEYFINEQSIKNRSLEMLRNTYIGFVFQLYYLIPNMSVRDNILLPTLYSKNKRVGELELDYLIKRLGIFQLKKLPIDKLSGGEKQRVAVARAMIMKPKLIIADEPTGALDKKNAEEIVNIFREYVNQGNSVVMVTHDDEISKKANKKYKLEEGRLYEI